MKTSFDIEALRAVVAGIEQGSFARAAAGLGRSQSAVSMQLKKLEEQVGVPLFVRKGRGLVPTEAGEALVRYARQIIALNDEAARAVGAAVTPETVRIGLPQDFFDDVMPATVRAFAERHPEVQVSVRAGNNHIIGEEIDAGRLDAAVAFFPKNTTKRGRLLSELPVQWLAHRGYAEPTAEGTLPLVLFNHPCLFRQAALAKLDQEGRRWRAALTTPSLAAVWAALRSDFGVGVRIAHSVPSDIVDVSAWRCLPALPPVELRLLETQGTSALAGAMGGLLAEITMTLLEQPRPARGEA
ncbi:MAG: LysR family transcriptional regulator [Pseudomonadota bacterium]